MSRPSKDEAASDPVAARTLTAVIAYLHLLDAEWGQMSDADRRAAVRLALEAAQRGRQGIAPPPET